jgi:outer membrane scaffolding protein for murein synthesis (MipA/OmpV family)
VKISLGFILILFSFKVFAQDLSLWEGGLGLLNFEAPHYRGSKQKKDYVWPLPYFIIRGDKIQAESSFIRGNFYRTDKYSFDLSTNAGLNVNSKDNQKRQNMPNINNSFELGVLFRYFLWKDENKENMLNFEMPIRSVFVTNFKSIDHIGYFSIPYLNFLSRPQHWNGFWSMEFSVGPMYGSKKLHNYYYSIAPDFSNPDRPAYESKPGYSGTQIALVMSKRIKKLLIFPWIRYDNLKGAAFIDSPLIETNHYVMGGIGLVYFFAQSGSLQRNDFQVK